MKLQIVVLLFCVFCLLGQTSAQESSKTDKSGSQEPIEVLDPPGAPSDDLYRDDTMWLFRPWKIWRWDSQLTVTRRDSSFIKSQDQEEYDTFSLALTRIGSASTQLASTSEHSLSEKPRAKGVVERELVTLFFEAMLDAIVESWSVIDNKMDVMEISENPSTAQSENVSKKQKKSSARSVSSKEKGRPKLNSRVALSRSHPAEAYAAPVSWWSGPDEKVKVKFHNGNTYEGNISMKCMHGEGKFQWASGVSYMGHFFYNEMRGRGMLEWRDQTWYEGEFRANLRHGRGMYVNSRTEQSYIGDWHCGMKHGQGVIHYSNVSSYDGAWENNVRHGFGLREYCRVSGYKGYWENSIQYGEGIMVWPNHDYYDGEWKDGLMSGNGLYIWSMCQNGTLSVPSQISYKGYWKNGMRHGHGLLRFGFGNGSHYKGQFYENRKHGSGSLVTGDGYILQSRRIFLDDNLASITIESKISSSSATDQLGVDPPHFDMCAKSVDLWYHVDGAIRGIDNKKKVINQIIDAYVLANNRCERMATRSKVPLNVDSVEDSTITNVEYDALQKAVKCYEVDLKRIYYQYATVCSSASVQFNPILIRLFMWQMYYDCKMHEKGLTLVEIDCMLYRNPAWLMRSKHDPFERVYYWQFLHSMITVASRLHSKKFLPTEPCDTILEVAFRTFMVEDILPNVGVNKGTCTSEYITYIPLNAMYKLYRSIREPLSVREFLMSVRYPPHWTHVSQPARERSPPDEVPRGGNVFVAGDLVAFITERKLYEKEIPPSTVVHDLKLFNLSNLSSKSIINNFAKIFPNIIQKHKIVDLDVQLSFLEFYEGFLACLRDSIALDDLATRYQEINSTELVAKTVISKKHV